MPKVLTVTMQELASCLYSEGLFLHNELDAIRKLNCHVKFEAERLAHMFWVVRQQHLHLQLLQKGNAEKLISWQQHSRVMESLQFSESYRELEAHHEYLYSYLFQNFVAKPSLVANCLSLGEEYKIEETSDVAATIMLCCYGNSFLTDDYKQLLEFIEKLFVLQYAYNVKKTWNKEDSPFAVVFKLFVEFLLNGKLFLASALHKPLMEVVTKHQILLQTNQQKLITSLTPDEIEQTFGTPDGQNFAENIKNHVKKAQASLLTLSLSFINGLLSSLNNFPQSLGWILARFFQILKGNSSEAKARSVCIDMLFSHFIYNAILNPEKYGIIEDLFISDTCRINLELIVETIQTSAKFENGNIPENNELMSSLQLLIDTIVNTYDSASVPPIHESLTGWTANAVLLTPHQLMQLVHFLESINRLQTPSIDHTALDDILSNLPTSLPPCLKNAVNWSLSANATALSALQVSFKDELISTSSNVPTPIGTPVSKAASKERIFSSEENIANESFGEIVLVIPLSTENDVDKQLGLLSEAEVLGIKTTPKIESPPEKSRAKTLVEASLELHDPSKEFGINDINSSIIKDKIVITNANSDTTHAESSSSSEFDPEDELYEYQVNSEIQPRYASVIRNDQWSVKDQSAVCMIKDDVIEVSCPSTDEEVEVRAKRVSTIFENSLMTTESNEDLPIANGTSFNNALLIMNNNEVSDTKQHLTDLKKLSDNDTPAENLVNGIEFITPNCLVSETNVCEEGEELARVSDSINSINWQHFESDEEHELSKIRERSMSKVQQILGDEVADEDAELVLKIVSENKSRNKAEQVLGIKLLKEKNKLPVNNRRTLGRAATNDSIPKGLDSPRKRWDNTTWKNWKRRALSSMTLKRGHTVTAKDIELKPGSFKDRLKRSSAEMRRADVDVMQKYEIQARLKRLHTGDMLSPGTDALSPSDSQSKASSENTFETGLPENPRTPLSPNSPTIPDYATLPRRTSALSPNRPYEPPYNTADIEKFVKKKLRDIFSKYPPPSSVFPSSIQPNAASTLSPSSVFSSKDDSFFQSQLLSCLQTHLATTHLMQDQADHLILVELIRCIKLLNENSCCSVIESLWEDYQCRPQYIAYLVRFRQQLLAQLAYVRRAIDGLQKEKAVLRHYAILQSVRSFLKRKEADLIEFCNEFAAVAADEKVALINDLLSSLYGQLVENPAWADALSSELTEAEAEIERQVFARVYDSAIFPNGDANIETDMMFQNFISSISVSITPKHELLQIPDRYLIGYPWLEAQELARAISIYRSPKDKLQAAVRCCETVVRMLELADRHAPASDDMIPVLLFVVIKANPPHLLSTCQYVDNFLGDTLSGQEGYLWTVFKSTLQFTKGFPMP